MIRDISAEESPMRGSILSVCISFCPRLHWRSYWILLVLFYLFGSIWRKEIYLFSSNRTKKIKKNQKDPIRTSVEPGAKWYTYRQYGSPHWRFFSWDISDHTGNMDFLIDDSSAKISPPTLIYQIKWIVDVLNWDISSAWPNFLATLFHRIVRTQVAGIFCTSWLLML